MDGPGRFQEHILIERLWWTLNYHYLYVENVYSESHLNNGLKTDSCIITKNGFTNLWRTGLRMTYIQFAKKLDMEPFCCIVETDKRQKSKDRIQNN